MNNTQRKALVTGGAGFIGSHLVDRLLADGWGVTVIDDLSYGYEHNLNPNAEFIKADLASPETPDLICKLSPQVVFHPAARVSVYESARDPLGDISINLVSTMNVLTGCVQAGVEKLVFSSTGGAIYGNPQQLPCTEAHPPEPPSPYGAGKFAAELYIRAVCDPTSVKYTVLRYANVYGPRQSHKGSASVVPAFFMAALGGKPPTIYGDGGQTRDYVYVDDVVDANLAAIESGDGEAFNIGTGVPLSVNQVYATISKQVGFDKPPNYQPGRPSEVRDIYLDITLAEKVLGWSPKLSFEAGISRTQAYYEQFA